MAARLSREDVLELIANDSDSGSEFEVSNDVSAYCVLVSFKKKHILSVF